VAQKHQTQSAAARIGLALILGMIAASRASTDELLHGWSFEMAAGYANAHGAVRKAFGNGIDGRLTVGRRLFSDARLEGSLLLGSVDYAAATTVEARECLPAQHGMQVGCSTQPVLQHGEYTGGAIGMTVPFRTDGHGRMSDLGAGAVFESYGIAPAGNQFSHRNGWGVYGSASTDLLRIGPAGGLGLALRATHVFASGDTLGTSIPKTSGDTWFNVDVQLRVGGRRDAK
jgi:hypothetical protein